MRVTSSLWVGAYIRHCQAAGVFAAVSRRGADEAGAIFVVVERLDGTADLYAPAPQSAFEGARGTIGSSSASWSAMTSKPSPTGSNASPASIPIYGS